MSCAQEIVYREGERISRGDIDRFNLLDQLLCNVSSIETGYRRRTNLISRVQRDMAGSHGRQEGRLAIVQPLGQTGLSTMTYSPCYWAYNLQSRYRIKSMAIRVVTAHKETRAQPGGRKQDLQLQLQCWGRCAWVDKIERKKRGFNPGQRLVGRT